MDEEPASYDGLGWVLKGHCGVKGLLKTIADLRCIACATGFLSTGPTVVGRAWSGNTAVPNVNLPTWGVKRFAGIAFPSMCPSPSHSSEPGLSLHCTYPSSWVTGTH